MQGNVFTTKLLNITLVDKNLFIVLEHIESDLKKVLLTTGSIEFNEEHVLTIIYNSLCSLNFVHSAGLMHRDIKPANILIDLECQVKLCDFGLSRPVQSNE